MLTSMESYLRRGQRVLQRLMVKPWLRTLVMALACSGGGFFLAAGSLLRHAQPLALGLVTALPGWQAVAAGAGSILGYWIFWGRGGLQGMVWSAAGALLGGMLSAHVRPRDQPLLLPAIAAFLTAITGLAFQTLLVIGTGFGIFLGRIGLAFFSALVFSQAMETRSPSTDWLIGAMGCLCLAQVSPWAWANCGYCLAGCIAAAGSLPGAVLAGLGLDLGGSGRISMTAALGTAWILGLIPLEKKKLRFLFPGISYICLNLAMGTAHWEPVPALVVGGGIAYLLPPRPESRPRRGNVSHAQVRLELGAQVMGQAQQLLLECQVPPIDQGAILQRAQQRSCGSCSARKTCPEQGKLSVFHLENPLEVDCRKQGRLIPELRRGQEQLKLLKADHLRQQEYRTALAQQYRFLGEYLRALADDLPRRESPAKPSFRVEAAVRSSSRERANGDRCLAFPGTGCRYYLALCDGMGTGLGAAQAGQQAGALLKQLLSAGFPARHALESLNSLLALTANAGAVTVDLAELCLDTGYAVLYKWGAAPSWLIKGEQAEKIGTATPPPGLSIGDPGQTVEKLSLSRGEVLVMLSDGVDGEEIPRRLERYAQGPPGELAAHLLHFGCRKSTDDATIAVIRLYPVTLGSS